MLSNVIGTLQPYGIFFIRGKDKTKEQIINELVEMRQTIAELQESVPSGEVSETERKR